MPVISMAPASSAFFESQASNLARMAVKLAPRPSMSFGDSNVIPRDASSVRKAIVSFVT